MTPEELLLLEQVVSAHRERTIDGVIKSHPAWHDLDAAGRVTAFDETMKQRALERSADRGGQSSTVKAVLARLRR
ncbi:MAG: hypothetical protein ABTQ32_24630 [Myxococcaceae bacterium]